MPFNKEITFVVGREYKDFDLMMAEIKDELRRLGGEVVKPDTTIQAKIKFFAR